MMMVDTMFHDQADVEVTNALTLVRDIQTEDWLDLICEFLDSKPIAEWRM